MAEFVTFEISMKLKQKGYPQLKNGTLAMYSEYGEWFSLARNLDDYEYSFVDFDEHDCVAPTISQARKWLREQKKLNVEIFLYNGTYSYCVKSVTKICEDCHHQWLNDDAADEEYDSYEEAELAGIEYCLNNLI